MLIKYNIGCVYYLKYLMCDYFNKNVNDMDVRYINVFFYINYVYLCILYVGINIYM